MDESGTHILKGISHKEALVGFILGCVVSVLFGAFETDKLRNVFITSVDATIPDSSKSETIRAEISGAVIAPGVYELPVGARVGELINYGRGFSSEASADWVTKNINSAELLIESQKIYVPFEWEIQEPPEIVLASIPATQAGSPGTIVEDISNPQGDITSNTLLVDVNLASAEELKTLPGIGDIYSQKIISGRPYTDASQFKETSGITDSTYGKIADLISF